MNDSNDHSLHIVAPIVEVHTIEVRTDVDGVNHDQTTPYRQGLTRRESLKWLGIVSASLTMPLVAGCRSATIDTVSAATNAVADHWPKLNLQPISAPGYGTDPNLVMPSSNYWPLTMSVEQRASMSLLVDIILPREGELASASELNVVDVIDEWISAPYPRFHGDRVEILSGLVWLDEESTRRFSKTFVQSSEQQRLQIIDDIAYETSASDARFARMAAVFSGLRALVVNAYFSSPEGAKEMGYRGNVAIVGDYPGPSQEAETHLQQMLKDLDLSAFAYKDHLAVQS